MLPSQIRARINRATVRACWTVVVLLLAGASCTVPNFEGPAIQDPPDGFFMQADTYQQRRMFPELDLIHHNAWVNTSWGEFSTIYLNGHPSRLDRTDVELALQAMKDVTTQPVTFGDVEQLTIDGRTAWGWAERLETQAKGLEWIAYRAVIPYDNVTYAIELFSGDPAYKREPASLRAIAASFAVGRIQWNLPLILVIAGLAGLAFNLARTRAAEREERMKRVPLVTIPKKEEEEEGAAEGAEKAPEPAEPGREAPPSAPGGARPSGGPPPPPGPAQRDPAKLSS